MHVHFKPSIFQRTLDQFWAALLCDNSFPPKPGPCVSDKNGRRATVSGVKGNGGGVDLGVDTGVFAVKLGAWLASQVEIRLERSKGNLGQVDLRPVRRGLADEFSERSVRFAAAFGGIGTC